MLSRVAPERVQAVRAELAGLELKADPEALAVYGHDESDAGDFLPDLVVLPRDTAQVQQVFRACLKHGVPVTPVGARTGKSGGSLPLRGGLSLSFERMNRILAIQPDDLLAVVQPGVITGALMQAADDAGLFYGPDPNSWESCTLGGNVAENAGGPRALKYGVTRDAVLAMEWVLPTGQALRVGHRTVKGVAGYDLVALFVGSEGTLGVATEITLKLLPRPRFVMTALLPFRDAEAAGGAVSEVLKAGLLPRCLELLDDVALKAVDGKGYTFPPGAGAVILAEVDGPVEEGVFGELQLLSEVCTRCGALDTLLARDESQRARLWAVRRQVSPSLRQLSPRKISDDIVVPRSRIAEAIRRFKEVGRDLGLVVATYGHAGDGNLHANVLFGGESDRPRVEEALSRMLKITVELGGTITGEHGVGIAKARFLGLEQAPELIDLQRRLQVFFDPAVILNPGKIFPNG